MHSLWHTLVLAHMVLSLLFVVCASDDAVLAEHLELSAFGGRVSACPAPFVVHMDMCTCGRGWTGTNTGSCVQCAAGAFKEDIGLGPCTTCPEHMTSFSAAQEMAECMCVPGYSAEGGICVPCATGTYKAFIGNSSCIACVPNAMTTLGGATTSAYCVCKSGHALVNSVCVECAPDHYSSAGVCKRCPANSASGVAAATCQCNAG